MNNDKDKNIFISFIKAFWKHIVLLLIWTIFIVVFLNYVIMISTVESGSMEPTLMTGETTFYNRLAYISKDVERGDIVVFFEPMSKDFFAKRVIGLSGDKIEFFDGYVYINGKKLDESAYLNEDIDTNCADSFSVPEGYVFLLGDNRENSKDSRFFPYHYISEDAIKGKYMFTLSHKTKRND